MPEKSVTLQQKYSLTPSAVPAPGSMTVGELAINVSDKTGFIGDENGDPVTLFGNVGGGDVTTHNTLEGRTVAECHPFTSIYDATSQATPKATLADVLSVTPKKDVNEVISGAWLLNGVVFNGMRYGAYFGDYGSIGEGDGDALTMQARYGLCQIRSDAITMVGSTTASSSNVTHGVMHAGIGSCWLLYGKGFNGSSTAQGGGISINNSGNIIHVHGQTSSAILTSSNMLAAMQEVANQPSAKLRAAATVQDGVAAAFEQLIRTLQVLEQHASAEARPGVLDSNKF